MLLLDLQAMDLLRPGVDVKDVALDKSKIDREKRRMKVKSNEKHKEDQEKLVCIGVNGKIGKDTRKIDKDTLMYREVMDENGETKLKKGTGEEHHLTLTKEPGTESGRYILTHRVIPVKGATAAVLSDEVHSVLKEFNSVHTLEAVLVDNTNTGCEGGLVTILENKTQRKLHIIGCSLHQNKLSFRAVFKHLDGSTKSPPAFTGPLEKLCETDHHDLPKVEFTQLSGPLDHMKFDKTTLDDLSSDQRLLLEYVLRVSKGEVNPRFAVRKIGPLNHARLTLAIRLMCLWTRGAYPPELQDKPRHAVKYIVQVYAVSWFEIKRDSKFHNQQLYIFTMIQRMKQQVEEIQSIAFKNLKYNAFALLPENVLYSMLKSDDLEVRKTAHKKFF